MQRFKADVRIGEVCIMTGFASTLERSRNAPLYLSQAKSLDA